MADVTIGPNGNIQLLVAYDYVDMTRFNPVRVRVKCHIWLFANEVREYVEGVRNRFRSHEFSGAWKCLKTRKMSLPEFHKQ